MIVITVILIIKVILTKSKWITKIITLLLMCMIIKTVTIEIIKILALTIMIMIVVIIIVIYKILLTWCKIRNGEMHITCVSKT